MRLPEFVLPALKTLGVLIVLLTIAVCISLIRVHPTQYPEGYPSDGHGCDYGYDSAAKTCCDEDDYRCEVRDKAPKGATAYCEDDTYYVGDDSTQACAHHGGINTDPQVSPY